MKSFFKKLGKTKLFILAILLIALIGIIVFLIATSIQNNEKKKDDEEYKENSEVANQIILKEMVYVKGEKISQDFLDYVLYMPDGINVDAIEMDFSNVDNMTVGTYEYFLLYFDTKNSQQIHIVDTKEEKETLQKEFTKQQNELTNVIEDNEPEEEEENKSDDNNNENNTNEELTSQQEPAKDNSSETKNPTINNTEETPKEPPKEVTKEPDRKVASYSYEPLNFIPDNIPVNLEGYNGEFWFVFDKPIIIDNYGTAAFRNWGANISSRAASRAALAAKTIAGKDTDVCAQQSDIIYAKNKDEDVLGVILKVFVGRIDIDGSCSVDLKPIYINDRTTLVQDNINWTFNEK